MDLVLCCGLFNTICFVLLPEDLCTRTFAILNEESESMVYSSPEVWNNHVEASLLVWIPADQEY